MSPRIVYVCIDDNPPRRFETKEWRPKPGDMFRIEHGIDEGHLEVLDVVTNPTGIQVQATRL